MNFAEITGINEWKLENLKLTWLVLVYVLLSFCSTKIYFSAHCQKFIISSKNLAENSTWSMLL